MKPGLTDSKKGKIGLLGLGLVCGLALIQARTGVVLDGAISAVVQIVGFYFGAQGAVDAIGAWRGQHGVG